MKSGEWLRILQRYNFKIWWILQNFFVFEANTSVQREELITIEVKPENDTNILNRRNRWFSCLPKGLINRCPLCELCSVFKSHFFSIWLSYCNVNFTSDITFHKLIIYQCRKSFAFKSNDSGDIPNEPFIQKLFIPLGFVSNSTELVLNWTTCVLS